MQHLSLEHQMVRLPEVEPYVLEAFLEDRPDMIYLNLTGKVPDGVQVVNTGQQRESLLFPVDRLATYEQWFFRPCTTLGRCQWAAWW
jgi:hypothetical protein